MFTQPWSPVDRKIGLGIAVCGLVIALLNSVAFAEQANRFAPWWVLLACAVVLLQSVTVVGWSRFPPAALRAIWIAQPPILLLVLLLAYLAWDGSTADPPSPQVWLLDSTLVAAMALAVRLPYVISMTLLLAAAIPVSTWVFLGTVPASVLAWGFVHASNVIYVMIAVVLRQQMDKLSRAHLVAERVRAEEERLRAESAEFERFARTVHDDVLSSFAAALQFNGEPPLLLRRGAAAALQAIRREGREPDAGPIELACEDARQLILDLIGSAAPAVEMRSTMLPGQVSSSAASALGLAAAEAARNAVRHAGGGSGAVVLGDGSISVTIVDSGPGFDPAQIPSGRFGIRESIVKRIENVDQGSVAFNSGPNGTTVVMGWTRSRG